jgi:polysaccharide biosynthesis protein PslG
MRRMLAITGTLVCLLLLAPSPGIFAASSFASPSFRVVWQRGEDAFPNFWGPLSLAKDGMPEPYKEAPGGQRLVQYFDKARMELTNPAMPTVVTNGLLTVELKTGKVQLGDNTSEQRSPARINIAGDPGSDSLTYADLAQLPERDVERSLPDLQPPRAFINGQIMATPELLIPGLPSGPGLLYGPYVQDPGKRYGQYVFKPFYDFINLIPQGQAAIGYPIAPAIVASVKVNGVPTYVLVQAFERRVLTFNILNPPNTRLEFGNIGQHYNRWRYP